MGVRYHIDMGVRYHINMGVRYHIYGRALPYIWACATISIWACATIYMGVRYHINMGVRYHINMGVRYHISLTRASRRAVMIALRRPAGTAVHTNGDTHMTTHTSRRYTLHLTAELDELIEARRAELSRRPSHMIQNTDTVTTVYTIRHLIGEVIERFLLSLNDHSVEPPELKPITGATTRTIKVHIPRSLDGALELLAEHAGLSMHATLRALIVVGAGS